MPATDPPQVSLGPRGMWVWVRPTLDQYLSGDLTVFRPLGQQRGVSATAARRGASESPREPQHGAVWWAPGLLAPGHGHVHQPASSLISTAVRSRAQGRRRGVSQAARGGDSTRERATATCTHQHGAARTETRGHRPPHLTCPLLLCRSGPRTCPWCRRGRGRARGKESEGPGGVRLAGQISLVAVASKDASSIGVAAGPVPGP